ncbi:MAG: hypothetical protein K8R69_11580 [Deltaproteobacteria bacterium]|nr:hypothetical protein [Deltaproteobacteria bacterium]
MLRDRTKKRFLSTLMALAIFAAGILVSFHHHEINAKSADHCATCMVAQHSRGTVDASAPPSASPEAQWSVSLAVPASLFLVSSPVLLGKFSQAPPAC